MSEENYDSWGGIRHWLAACPRALACVGNWEQGGRVRPYAGIQDRKKYYLEKAAKLLKTYWQSSI